MLKGITWELGGTSREHDENMLRAHWEQGRRTKFNAHKGFILFVLETTSLFFLFKSKSFYSLGWGNVCSFGSSPLILCLKNTTLNPN
jgi:hypothetical protein